MDSEIVRFTLTEITNREQIGNGSGGRIYKGDQLYFGKVAVKEVFWSKEHPLEKYKQEIEALVTHRHRNIVRLFGTLWDGENAANYLGYVMEYMEESTLHDVIYNKTESYNILERHFWIKQIALGLQFLHINGVIHRDVKPENIYLCGNTPKLAGFGIAKSTSLTAGVDALHYTAPEVFTTGQYGPAADIYSLAITIWEIFHREKPYSELGRNDVAFYMQEVKNGARPRMSSTEIDRDSSRFIESCWQEDIPGRPPIARIIQYFGSKFENLENRTDYETALGQSIDLSSFEEEDLTNTILVKGSNQLAVLNSDRSKWIHLEMCAPSDGVIVYLNQEIIIINEALFKQNKAMEWIHQAYMHEKRQFIGNSCLAWNGSIWVFGGAVEIRLHGPLGERVFTHNYRDKLGMSSFPMKYLRTVKRYDPQSNTWTQIPKMKYARAGASAAIWNGKVIICGGSDGCDEILNTVECFDPESSQWTLLTDMPTPLFGHSLVSYKNKLVVMGGHNGITALDSVMVLDSLDGNWQQLPSMKYPRMIFFAITLGSEIFAIGGNEKGQVEIFDGKEWRDGPCLPGNWKYPNCTIVPENVADLLCRHKNTPSKCVVS